MDLFKQFPSTSLMFDEEYETLFQLLDFKAISSSDLITLSSLELAKSSGRSSVITKKFQNALENEISSTISVTDLNLQSLDQDIFKSFTSGDEKIDSLLGGGIRVGHLTEIVGSSATGKSHFLLQLSITVQLPRELGGLGYQISDDMTISSTQSFSNPLAKYQLAKAVYISTESGIETRRLSQICNHMNSLMETNGISEKYWPTTDNVFQITCNDMETQDNVIFYRLPQLLKTENVKLIIIDSIAHHLRIEMNTKDHASLKRNLIYFYKVASFLKKLANDHQLSVVVANQVSDRPFRQIHGPDANMTLDYQLGWLSGWDDDTILERQNYSDSSVLSWDVQNTSFEDGIRPNTPKQNFNNKQIPALGVIWQNKLDHRIVLSKYRQPIWEELLESIRDRELENLRRRRDQAQDEQRDENHDELELEDEEVDISRHFELMRKVWYNGKSVNFQIWKGGIRGDSV